MSLRYEQYHALLRTREFLRELLLWEGRMNKRDVRAKASACLKHYPFLDERGQPYWSKDPFTKDREDGGQA